MTAASVDQGRLDLAIWKNPDAFKDAASALISRVTAAEFFNVASLGFLREAWTLSRYAELIGARRVRLSDPNQQFPDGHVDRGGEVEDVEITEVMMSDRRRGQEFMPDQPVFWEDPGHEWERRLRALPGELERAFARKAAKRYSPRPVLVAYLNISTYGHRDEEMLAEISRAKDKFRREFSDIHILWQGSLV